MKRQSKHILAAVESFLNAVAMVRVNVNVKSSSPSVLQLEKGEANVIDKAESRRAVRLAVVPPARKVNRNLSATGQQQVDCVQARPSDPAAIVVNAWEHGAIVT
jgi:hypothetical protein